VQQEQQSERARTQYDVLAGQRQPRIESFSTAHPVLGEPVPIDRVVFGSSTRLGSIAAAIVLDAAGNRLYVANGTEILVFDNASSANGNQVPRVIQKLPAAFIGVASLFLDAASDQ
jgi:hypothetical protein